MDRQANVDEVTGEPSKAAIARLVRRLNSLEEGEQIVGKLLAYGSSVIGPLKYFLFQGKPSTVYQPRRWAVEVLAGVRAKDVLIDYLKWKTEIPDPAVRLAEQAVENETARALARCWPTEDVFDTLLKIAVPHPQLGLIEALGEFQKAEAMPYFINALEDDVCRSAAEGALRKLGRAAAESLVEAAVNRVPSGEEETPSSLLRRASALKLLGDIELPPELWQILRPLLADLHPDIVIAASNIAAHLGTREDKITAVKHLIDVLSSADWFAQGEIEACLISLYAEGKDMIDAEIARRNSLPDQKRVVDRALRTLLRVKRLINHLPSGRGE